MNGATLYDGAVQLLIARAKHPWWSRALLPVCAWIGVAATRLARGSHDADVSWGDLPDAAVFGLVGAGIVFVSAFAVRRLGWWVGALVVLYAFLHRPRVDSAGSLILGVLTLLGNAFLLSPVLALTRTALRHPAERSVAHECLVVAIYGHCVIALTRWAMSNERVLITNVVAVATIAVGVLGLAWDLAARAQVRAVMRGRVAGWRIGDGVAADLPRLWWLNAFDAERSRVLYRTTAGAVVYRGAAHNDEPVARVPPEVPPVGFAALLCGAQAVLAAMRWRVGD